MNNKTIMEILAQIQRDAQELAKLSRMTPTDFADYVEQEPSIYELTLSEMVGMPIRIQK